MLILPGGTNQDTSLGLQGVSIVGVRVSRNCGRHVYL